SNDFIAQTPGEVYATLHPDKPLEAGDARYVPLDQARGMPNLATELAQRLAAREQNVPPGSPRVYARFLVTGPSGCGKTTELLRLKEELARQHFAVVYFDGSAEFDVQRETIGWWQLLLEMVWQIDETLSRKPYHIQIPEPMREEAVEWLARVITNKTDREAVESSLVSEFGVDAALPFFGKAKEALKDLLKTGSSLVREMEREAELRPTALLDAVQDIINHVQRELRKRRGCLGLVIIADGLEKMPLRSLGENLTTHSILFVNQ